MIRTILSVPALLGLLALGACGTGAQSAASDIKITAPWTTATPPGALTATGYVSITNDSAVGDRLVGISSPLAAGAMLHDMTISNGIASMRTVDGIDIPAGKTVTLAPDGFHMMFVTMKQPFKVGDAVPVTLTFQKAGRIDAMLPVLPLGTKGPAA